MRPPTWFERAGRRRHVRHFPPLAERAPCSGGLFHTLTEKAPTTISERRHLVLARRPAIGTKARRAAATGSACQPPAAQFKRDCSLIYQPLDGCRCQETSGAIAHGCTWPKGRWLVVTEIDRDAPPPSLFIRTHRRSQARASSAPEPPRSNAIVRERLALVNTPRAASSVSKGRGPQTSGADQLSQRASRQGAAGLSRPLRRCPPTPSRGAALDCVKRNRLGQSDSQSSLAGRNLSHAAVDNFVEIRRMRRTDRCCAWLADALLSEAAINRRTR